MPERAGEIYQEPLPTVVVGRVVEHFPELGFCIVEPMGFPGAIRAFSLMSNGTVNGTPKAANIDFDYYENQKKGKYSSSKDHRHAFSGDFYDFAEDTLVVVLTSGLISPIPGREGNSFGVIVGCLSFAQFEAIKQIPVKSASKDYRYGDPNNENENGDRVIPSYKNYLDEVGHTEDERKKLSDKYEGLGPGELVLHQQPDIYWERRFAASYKPKWGLSGLLKRFASYFVGLTNLVGSNFRFARREFLDAKRLTSKYKIPENEADNRLSDISSTHSEMLMRFDKQGKLLIGAELGNTLIECHSDADSDYEGSQGLDPATAMAMGRSCGLSYVELSSKDWRFDWFNRGITHFGSSFKVRGYPVNLSNRRTLLPQVVPEVLTTPNSAESWYFNAYGGNTIYYQETERSFFNVGRMHVLSEGVEFTCSPSEFFIGGVSLATLLNL